MPRGCAAYCASKGAVDSLTRTLACEWARHNVLVNALAPTVVETEFTRAIVQDPRGAEHLKRTIPLGPTNNFGDFEFDDLQADSGEYGLEVEYPGYQKQEMKVDPRGSVNVGTILL